MATPVNKKLINRGITIGILTGIIFLLIILAGYPGFVERYYWGGVYQFICKVLHPVLNLFPFSVGDVLYVAMVGGIIYGLIQLLKLFFTKQFKRGFITLTGLIISAQSAVVIFYVFWGMNYFRPPASQRFGLSDTAYTVRELKAVTALLIDSANATRSRLAGADLKPDSKEIYAVAINAVKKMSAHSNQFRPHRPQIKSSLLTPLMNYLGTSGYYNPFTTEAQINYGMPVFLKPFVACHELSHQMGIAPEDEANFAGYIAGISSNNRLLRYSAYYSGMTEFMYALRATDSVTFKLYKKRISANVLADLKAEHAYWTYYEGRLEKISSVFYDNFLKANNQPQGLLTYNQMITLVMAWSRQNR
ncbi:DUF3810 domain-containing protein [Mucilaginibacter hurinus]|nr:DUF3810 domain-containing protein [Mucilaginibacter hurinus]